MNIKDYIVKQGKMCTTLKSCKNCEIYKLKGDDSCAEFRMKNPEKTIKIVEEWAKWNLQE